MWGVVLVCLDMHAAKLYLVRGYSTEYLTFAQTWHTADWGVPLTVYTDKGMQLVQVGQEQDYDQDAVKTMASEDWKFKQQAKKLKIINLEVKGPTKNRYLKVQSLHSDSESEF